VNGTGYEIADEFRFVLSLSKHGDYFFNRLLQSHIVAAQHATPSPGSMASEQKSLGRNGADVRMRRERWRCICVEP